MGFDGCDIGSHAPTEQKAIIYMHTDRMNGERRKCLCPFDPWNIVDTNAPTTPKKVEYMKHIICIMQQSNKGRK
jgi:hypothetical protein